MRVALASGTSWREVVVRERARGADLICLPHLSFTPYVAAERDRAGLELAERPPSRSLREALELADGAWLAASAYESEGEGVFYVTSYLAGPDSARASYRQRVVEAAPGRYEQMFWSPGHDPYAIAEPAGQPSAPLVGADLRNPAAWDQLAAAGARVVLGGSSEPAELWAKTRRMAAAMAARHGIVALLTNRRDESHPGGCAGFGSDGDSLRTLEEGIYEVEPR